MSRSLRPVQILTLARLVEAVQAQQHVRFTGHQGQLLEGTLRGFVPAEGQYNTSFLPDMRDSWVRITLVQGGDTWVSVDLAADLIDEGEFAMN